jgi:hypothetical protein
MIPFLSAEDSNEKPERKERRKQNQNSDQRKLVLGLCTVAPIVVLIV